MYTRIGLVSMPKRASDAAISSIHFGMSSLTFVFGCMRLRRGCSQPFGWKEHGDRISEAKAKHFLDVSALCTAAFATRSCSWNEEVGMFTDGPRQSLQACPRARTLMLSACNFHGLELPKLKWMFEHTTHFRLTGFL